MNIIAYHGTDLTCANKIISSDFMFKENDAHWLGNGVYFYLDLSLAQWWTTNPSSVFGNRVIDPAIIQVELEVQEDEVLDLRKLSDYKHFTSIYFKEFLPLVHDGVFGKSLKDFKKLRCTFFGYLVGAYNLKMVIGNFSLPKQSYLPDHYNNISNKLKLYYIETQVCVFDTSIIVSKNIMNRGD